MAKDYKDRGEGRTKKRLTNNTTEKPARWILIGSLVLIFVAFLVYLKSTAQTDKTVSVESSEKTALKIETSSAKKTEKVEKPVPVEPKFDFYTILPDAEIVVPEHEIKTRIREELVGKVKKTQYTLQAGAFRDFKDADHLRAELALMNITSKIEKAKVGDVVWSRVKLGPYAQLASVEKVKSRLRKSGIDVIITEASK
ncbi:MAG: SPOR domain-containing protein [Methylococcaceae bacterium]|nr:SPOR domain-containing protein [Methylococcaceae bacterium]